MTEYNERIRNSNNSFISEHDIDLSYKLINTIEEKMEEFDINDYIEVFLACKIIQKTLPSSDMNEDVKKTYQNTIKGVMKTISKFFKEIDVENIISRYQAVIPIYRNDFWQLFDNYKLSDQICQNEFPKLLLNDINTLHHILHNKNLVTVYSDVIRTALITCSKTAEWLITYRMGTTNERTKRFFLPELSKADINSIFLNYIESSDAIYSYMCRISRGSNNSQVHISDKIRFKAQERSKQMATEIFSSGTSLEYGANICFEKDMDDVVIIDEDYPIFRARYSYEWLENNLDYPTLLNNFIYLFEYVSYFDMRCLLVSNKATLGIFESLTIDQSKSMYQDGTVFELLNMIALAQMTNYYENLKKLGIRLEEVFEWFFIEYLKNEFMIDNFDVILPSKESTCLEKCTMIMPALEHVLKKFTIYCEEGTVNNDFLDFQSDQLIYADIPSLLNKKYIYAHSADCSRILYLLFSSPATNRRTEQDFESLFECINSEDTKCEDLFDFQGREVEWLVKKDILLIDENKMIKVKSREKADIYYMLYGKEVIVYPHLPNCYKILVDKMIDEGTLSVENTLFSRQEAEYFNFHLNRRCFLNSHDLRNKYLHFQPRKGDVKQQKLDYMIFLKLFVIAIIKINDDLCCRDQSDVDI